MFKDLFLLSFLISQYGNSRTTSLSVKIVLKMQSLGFPTTVALILAQQLEP